VDEAKRAVLAGEVSSPNTPLTQPGISVDPSIEIHLRNDKRFVSRGGDKLAAALKDFHLAPKGLRCLDVGASTGGFTDCLLKNGAAQVLAVDVAYGQLAWQLRSDPRVQVLERTNIRDVDPGEIGAPFDLIVVDVSFTSLSSLLPMLVRLLAKGGTLIALVKPQFELPALYVGEKGVITDQAAHAKALEQVIEAATGSGLAVQGASFSPITGAKGNIEFLLAAQQGGIPATIDVDDVITRAHARLDKRR
jgi:23S rRNA (cytidine1920-2'-O)/16S rRNA (cytidine1409-2'-O)-methyltransferase